MRSFGAKSLPLLTKAMVVGALPTNFPEAAVNEAERIIINDKANGLRRPSRDRMRHQVLWRGVTSYGLACWHSNIESPRKSKCADRKAYVRL
jgi:hypothetical protein